MAQKADGTVYINSLMDTSGFKAGSRDIESAAKRMASRVAGVIASAFAVKQLVQFGKEAVELGSALSEVQNVVDVTFGNLSKEVDDFAKNAITQFGLSETAAKQYTSTMGAMLKSMGLTTREAADMSMSMTGLAADMASFYNLDAEDAFYKIRAGISGETEPLKQLGINMSVANLEAFALAQGINKSYNAMTQQEQAMLRYNYLLSVTSDAQGDFSRTSESWANQTRVLSEQFKAIKATIGQGLINVFTPVLKVINTLLAKLATLANAFKSFTELITGNKSSGSTGGAAAGLGGGASTTDMADGYNQAADGAENLAGATEDAADATKKAEKAAKGYLNPLDEIHKWENDTDSLSDVLSPDTSGGKNAGDQLAGAINDVDYGALAEGETVIDKMSDSLLKVKEILTGLFKPFKEAWKKEGGATVDAALYALESIGELAKSVGKSFYDVWTNGTGTTTLTLILQIVQNILNAVGNLSSRFTEAWNKAGAGTRIVQSIFDIFNIILGVIGRITEATANWAANLNFTPLLEAMSGLLESMKPLIQNIGDGIVWLFENLFLPYFKRLIEVYIPRFIEMLDGLATALNGLIDFVAGVFTGDWERAWDGIKQIVKGALKIIKNIIKNVLDEIQLIADGAATLIANLIVLALNGIITFIASAMNKITSIIKTTWNAIKTVSSTIWNAIKSLISTVVNAIKTTVTNSFSSLRTKISNVWKSIKSDASNSWNSIKTSVVNIAKNIKTTIINTFSNIRQTMRNIGINIVNGIIEGIASVWNTLRSWAQSIFDMFTFSISGRSSGGSSYSGGRGGVYSMGIPTTPAFPVPDIPYLAKGAVIPPNAPFAAILGDQRRGNNLELPEDLLRKIIREETGGNQQKGNSTYRFTAQINRRTLFEEVINEAALYQSIYGRNPFELG